MFNGKILEAFLLKSVIGEDACHHLFYSILLGRPSQYSKTEIKWLQGLERKKQILSFPDDRINHRNPKECTNNFFFNNKSLYHVIGNKIKIEKSIAFPYLSIGSRKMK